MSRSEWFDRLMQMGTGFCGWTEQQTLATRIPVIELAYEGVIERLRMCYGSGEPDKPTEPSEKPTGRQIFDVIRMAATPTK